MKLSKITLAIILSFNTVACAMPANTSSAVSIDTVVDDSRAEPLLPAVYLDTTYVRPTGRTIQVKGGPEGARDFQAALDSATAGDTIALEAGAEFVGNFTLPAKPAAGDKWITIRSAAPDTKLPPVGTRVSPAFAHAMPKLISPGATAVIKTAPGAHHFWFIGVEFTVAPGFAQNYGLVLLGDGGASQNSIDKVPHDIVIDRCYIHGNQTGNLRRGIALNSAKTAVVDSYVSDCREVGADSQAICGWNGPGPFKIVNNYLEGAGENFMLGGADPRIANLVPSDVEFRLNHCSKPLSWNPRDPTFAGTRWSVKNLFELKNARRVLIEGNLFENNWVDAQSGPSILFTPRNQDGTAPWSTVEDVTFRDNVIRNVAAGVSILGRDDLHPSQQTRRIKIENNLFDEVGGAKLGGNGRLFQLLSGAAHVIINHNTAFQAAHILIGDGAPSTGLVYTNNITAPGEYGIFGGGASEGLISIEKYFPQAIIAGNIFVGRPSKVYPRGNFFAASLDEVGFVDRQKRDYRLKNGSAFKRAGTDGRDIGCDIEKLKLKE
ncbi:MAG TPA: hypothetical protein VF131_28070 [Blastocatellia bacterium]|nr:hypothetical protein [Blastocatellia bacterium]